MLNLCLPTSTPTRSPGRKPTGAKLALKPVHVWGIRIRLQVGGDPETWRFSTLRSIASCAAVTWRASKYGHHLEFRCEIWRDDPPAQDRTASAVRGDGADQAIDRELA